MFFEILQAALKTRSKAQIHTWWEYYIRQALTGIDEENKARTTGEKTLKGDQNF